MLSIDLELSRQLAQSSQNWLVTGAAGFIGSHLVETLLAHKQKVRGLDNFSTGSRSVVEFLSSKAEPGQFEFVEGDIRSTQTCQEACAGIHLVLHQAALGSVPRSIENPLLSSEVNVQGFLNVMMAAQQQQVLRVVFASSSSVYGDSPSLPKVEDLIGRPLSPYAASKFVNEVYAGVFKRCYGLDTVGLRYFNVYGPRQNPNGAYAAVIPRWVLALIEKRSCEVFGDGCQSRDF
ncbi:MAG: NAD-dependent epimerase/dehydratase family protein, partial [Bdellovibrionales bacterium]|nr:NAD-dependent epimerase/dehydratase family protein [Bdellovibrionales bacterium]